MYVCMYVYLYIKSTGSVSLENPDNTGSKVVGKKTESPMSL